MDPATRGTPETAIEEITPGVSPSDAVSPSFSLEEGGEAGMTRQGIPKFLPCVLALGPV